MKDNEQKKIGVGLEQSGKSQDISPLHQKLLLVAILTGNEVIISFQQLYEVSLLQILGVPVICVTMYPLVAGPTAVILLYLLGRFSDRGSNSRQRKIAVVVINSAITVCGIVLLVTAIIIFLSHNDSSKPTLLPYNDSWPHANVTYGMDNVQSVYTWSLDMAKQGDTGINSSVHLMPVDTGDSQLALPITAILGMCGATIIGLSYDMSIGTSRACILACSAKQDHVSLLALSLVMSSAGGIFNNIMGIIDLTQLCPSIHGNRVAIQAAIQLMICCIVHLLCLASTVITAHFNIRHINKAYLTGSDDKEQNGYGTFLSEDAIEGKIPETRYSDNTDSGCQETDLAENTKCLLPAQPAACRTLSVSGNHQPHADLRDSAGSTDSIVSSEAVLASSDVCSPLAQQALGHSENWRRQRFNFVIACSVSYFGTCVTFSYNLFTTNFLGKVVFKGDSTAPEGSAELKAFEEGMRYAAGGLLLFYCCYLAFSTVHDRLLKLLGMKLDFCLFHVLVASCILAFTLSKQVAFFFVSSALYGCQRAILLTQPFIITNDYHHEKTKGTDDQANVGKTFAILTSMIPLNFCTIYFMSGPLIYITNYVGMPLLIGAGAAYLTAAIFLLYKP